MEESCVMNLKSGSVICQRLSADRSVPECSEQTLKKTILKCSSCVILYRFSRTFRPSLPATVQTAGHRTNIRPHKFPSAHCRVVNASANNKTKDSENYANALKVSNLRQLSLTKPSLDENGITTADEMNWLIAAAARSDADEKLTALKAIEAELMETNFPPDLDHFIVHVNVMPSGHFLGWIISLGKGVRIIKPE